MTSLTDMAGFASLVTAPLPILRWYGVLVAFGAAWALLLSLFALPAALVLLRPPAWAHRHALGGAIAQNHEPLRAGSKTPMIETYARKCRTAAQADGLPARGREHSRSTRRPCLPRANRIAYEQVADRPFA